MADIKDLLAYLLQQYPHQSELSNARVTKMVYLCDWKHSLENGKQITNINWYFDNFGPFVWDVIDTAKSNPDTFAISSTENFYGTPKTQLVCNDVHFKPKLSTSEKAAADHVIEMTKPLSWKNFIALVYSTYPIVKTEL